jgi:DNA-binding response OmpR family regulator
MNMMKKIVIIEDEEAVRDNLQELLILEGFDVQSVDNGKAGVQVIQECLPDLVICDVMMPLLDGYGVLTILRQQPNTASIPFIFLTAKATRDDFRQGMGMGADDYITKPFTTDEVLNAIQIRLLKKNMLRMNVMQNLMGELQTNITSLSNSLGVAAGVEVVETPGRLEPKSNPYKEEANRNIFTQGALKINFDEHLVTVNEQEVKLTRYQYDLLVYFVKNAGRIITHRAALENVWGPEYEKESQYLHVFVNQLRQKIEPEPARPQFIITERGVGYRFRKALRISSD